jgi:hypothetical protein
VLETTDLVLAVDSVAAVFGVTRDPFLVYSSNVCAILGLRALYFLLAGILQYFQYLDEGLAITVMFIGAKMLANPWVHISTGLSLAIVGGIIALSILLSLVRSRIQRNSVTRYVTYTTSGSPRPVTPELIAGLADNDSMERAWTASSLFGAGLFRVLDSLQDWEHDEDWRSIMVRGNFGGIRPTVPFDARLTVGIAVLPETFNKIRAACGSPPLADAPADQDVVEFELVLTEGGLSDVRLDILTTKAPGGDGAIARFLAKFGEGIQQVEIDVTDVDRATEILRTRFKIEPIYPETRVGANGTRVNFFLVTARNDQKTLVELVENPKRVSR